MGFTASLTQGWKLFTLSIAAIKRYPILLAPLILVWIVLAAIAVGLQYVGDIPLWLIFLLIFVVAYSISAACLVLLEVMQQIEAGEKPRLMKAWLEFIAKDSLKVLPIAFVWAVIWFILLILQALSAKSRRKSQAASLENTAKSISDMATPFSWFRLGLDMVEKLIRMTVFSILPAIAWQGLGPWKGTKRGIGIIIKHPVEFLANYGLTGIAVVCMGIPLSIISYIDQSGTHLPVYVWIAVIIYSGIVWTLGMYLEQMSVALLFLWHLKWEQAGSPEGGLSSIPQPQLLGGEVTIGNSKIAAAPIATAQVTSPVTHEQPSGQSDQLSNPPQVIPSPSPVAPVVPPQDDPTALPRNN